ncbi:TauD/TfdA family dioxygenase [Tomitella biformata]|uniref:TauD/TfdA family dioxygenase n=1 Tax=Tomitella biformata TaxID=630403 RepID=UPI000465D711|nr:TauD/TfdA family dioxygenase [Tomitella biformata]
MGNVKSRPRKIIQSEVFLSEGDRSDLEYAATSSSAAAATAVASSIVHFSAKSFAEHGNSAGYLIIHGLPHEWRDTPSTPTEAGYRMSDQHPSSRLLRAVARSCGTLVGYEDELEGTLLRDVYPTRGGESGPVDFRTENVHHPLRPDILGLYCLRRDRDGVGAMRVASVHDAIGKLGDQVAQTLSEPRFLSGSPSSDGLGRGATTAHPVLFRHSAGAYLRFNGRNTIGLDRAATEAIVEFRGIIAESARTIVLAPGDMVLIDNHAAAHGRTAFTPRYDGSDGWLRRFHTVHSMPQWARRLMPRPGVIPRCDVVIGMS